MISKSKVLRLTLGAVLLLTIALIVWLSLKCIQTMGGYRGGAIAQLLEVLPKNLSDLGELVVTNYSEYRANAVRWSAAYFGCLFGAAFLSACAGVLIKAGKFEGASGPKERSRRYNGSTGFSSDHTANHRFFRGKVAI